MTLDEYIFKNLCSYDKEGNKLTSPLMASGKKYLIENETQEKEIINYYKKSTVLFFLYLLVLISWNYLLDVQNSSYITFSIIGAYTLLRYFSEKKFFSKYKLIKPT